jgi:hypothetical protein
MLNGSKTMKKGSITKLVTVIMIVAVAISGYFIFRPSKANTVDYTNYNLAKQVLVQNEHATTFKYCSSEAYLVVNVSTYQVSVVLANATETLQDVDILVMNPADSSSVAYPSLGLLDDNHYNLIPGKTSSDDNKPSFLLSFDSKNGVSTVYVYLAYTLNGTRQEEYVELTPKI